MQPLVLARPTGGYPRATFSATDSIFAPAESYNPVRPDYPSALVVSPSSVNALGSHAAPASVPILGVLAIVALLLFLEHRRIHL